LFKTPVAIIEVVLEDIFKRFPSMLSKGKHIVIYFVWGVDERL
jgi:hypothetical protein